MPSGDDPVGRPRTNVLGVELILADGKRGPLGGSGRQIQDHGVSGIKDDSLQGLTYVQAKALDEKDEFDLDCWAMMGLLWWWWYLDVTFFFFRVLHFFFFLKNVLHL